MVAVLVDLDLEIDKKHLMAVMGQIDTNQDNVIQFEEFLHFMLENPYL